MTDSTITRRRLHNQRLTGTRCASPEAVVRWLGAVQSQDYGGAKWAVAQRTERATDAALDQALTEGTILRTHLLRPTWHFVVPADIRWMLALTGPRVLTGSASRHRQLALDAATCIRGATVIAAALAGGHYLTRAELGAVLERAGIAPTGQRLVYVLMYAELTGVICSGPPRGREFTYALLDERAPPAQTLHRDEALATLALRYMTSHGPATLQDFAWWSGLTVADARAGIAAVGSQLMRETIDGREHWFAASAPTAGVTAPTAWLLPNYDEYIVAYTDRSAAIVAPPAEKRDARGNLLFNHIIVIDGQVVGTWKRVVKKDTVIVETTLFAPLNEARIAAIASAAEQYGRFLGLSATLRITA